MTDPQSPRAARCRLPSLPPSSWSGRPTPDPRPVDQPDPCRPSARTPVMRILGALSLAMLSLAGCGGNETPSSTIGSASRPPTTATATVTISGFKFGTPVRVDRGTTVTWINQDRAPHTATGEGFDTGTLTRNGHASHEFTATGTFNYVCQLHPYMHGTVIVN